MFLHQKFQLAQLIQTGFLTIIRQKQLILENNINDKLYLQRTPLHIAVICNQIQIALYLLKFNPNLHAKDSIGLTPYHWIQLKKNKQMFEPILKCLNGQKKQQKNQLAIEELNALRASQISIQKLPKVLLKKEHLFMKDQFGRRAIHWAALSGNAYAFNYLLENKFDPFQQDNFGFNSYHYIQCNIHNPLNLKLKLNFELKQQIHYEEGNQSNLNQNFEVKQNYYDTIIIGGGASGIGAGVTLSRNGMKYLVLQARDRIGGRIISQKVNDVDLDLGASWVHSYSKNNAIAKEIKNLSWKPRKAQKRSDSILISEQKGFLSNKIMAQCQMLQRSYFQIAQYKAKQAEHDMSIEQAGKQYYQKNIAQLPLHKKSMVDMLIGMSEHYHAASASELSARYFQEQEDTGGDFSPEYSYSSLLKAIAKTVDFQDKVKFNHEVLQIDYQKKQKDQYCTITCKNGTKFYAKKVISSLPLGLLKKQAIKFKPDLPQDRKQIIKKLGFGVMNKLIVSFQKPFWEQNPHWIRVACQQKGKFSTMFNLSREQKAQGKSKHILCCFLTDNFAKKISKQTNEQILHQFIEVLKRSFKNNDVKVLDYAVTRWEQDPYALGSYTHFDVDTKMESTKKLRKNIEQRLWIVGQHCYGEHIGCAHGAYQTGILAAQQILSIFKRTTIAKQKDLLQKQKQ